MSSFLSQNINWPWYYWFASPGWQEVHRTTNVICMGKTYGSVEVPVACAYPVNFHQTSGQANAGNLVFSYAWDSSTGANKLTDLAQCEIGEVIYGFSTNPPPSPPFPAEPNAFPDPWAGQSFSGSLGSGQDTHRPGNASQTFVTPYQVSTYTTKQIYRYRCPCKSSNAWQLIYGPTDIIRSVSQSSNHWKYTITKSSVTATIDPLP